MTSELAAFGEEVASGYEAWYGTPEGRRADALEKAVLQRMLHCFPDAHSVLEVGAGTGHFTRWLSGEGLTAVGFDLSAAMLREAKRLNDATWIQGDAYRLPFAQGAFDVVALITTLEFLSRPHEALSEGLRVARQGLLLGVLNRWSPLGIQRRLTGLFRPSVYDEARFYSVRALEGLLRSVAGERARLVWETTLMPDGWPEWLPHRRWGGFIAMALVIRK
jgi:ubiquinone/menaquinone biosynthesis C-methylase UbiE